MVEPTTLSLIVAAVITSPDRHIFLGQECSNLQRVSKLNESIIECLQNYLHYRKNSSTSFVKGEQSYYNTFAIEYLAMSLLVKLRNLTDMVLPKQLKTFIQMRLPMEPLIAELYNLNS